MTKKQIKKYLGLINNVKDIEDKRKICQEFSDNFKFGLNFKILCDDEVEKSFFELKEAVNSCLK